ncbi:amidase [Colwelliaceae bacterium 6441]
MASSDANFDEVLTSNDAIGQADLIRQGEISSEELVQASINRIEALNGKLNAVVTPMYEKALAQAKTSKHSDGPFAGVPMLIKDLFARVEDVRLTEGSKSLKDFVSPDDSELISRYRKAGLIMLGKTNTSEFGATPVTESHLLGPAKNPWDLSCNTGGSSGGSASAVATSMVAVAHGNDGGGSLRTPASCCGVFGFKPSRGRNPLGPEYGDLHTKVICENVITRTVRDNAAMLDATHGAMPGSPYTPPAPKMTYLKSLDSAPRPLRIAMTEAPLVYTPVHSDCSAALSETAKLCQELGHEVHDTDPKVDAQALLEAWFGVWATGNAWFVLETEKRTGRAPREEDFEPLTWQYYLKGKDVTAIEHLRRLRVLDHETARLGRFLENYDAWLTPTLAQPPLKLGGFYHDDDVVQRYVGFAPYCRLANIAGLPAMSVPLHWSAGSHMPIGSHFSASYGDETTLFQLAKQLEDARPWRDKIPPMSAITK